MNWKFKFFILLIVWNCAERTNEGWISPQNREWSPWYWFVLQRSGHTAVNDNQWIQSLNTRYNIELDWGEAWKAQWPIGSTTHFSVGKRKLVDLGFPIVDSAVFHGRFCCSSWWIRWFLGVDFWSLIVDPAVLYGGSCCSDWWIMPFLLWRMRFSYGESSSTFMMVLINELRILGVNFGCFLLDSVIPHWIGSVMVHPELLYVGSCGSFILWIRDRGGEATDQETVGWVGEGYLSGWVRASLSCNLTAPRTRSLREIHRESNEPLRTTNPNAPRTPTPHEIHRNTKRERTAWSRTHYAVVIRTRKTCSWINPNPWLPFRATPT